jgi:predicted O-methyltransferase YrrM
MIYPKQLLRTIKASWKNQVVLLYHPWNAKARYKDFQIPGLAELLAKNQAEYEEIVQSIIREINFFQKIPLEPIGSLSIYWRNQYLPGLDIVSLYTIVKAKKPSKIIEIGSGHSTVIMRRAVSDAGLHTKMICIDPAPRRDIREFSDQWIDNSLESLESLQIFTSLAAGDILFFDGSHLCLPNSDVVVFFLEILPTLASGVIVHLHDIYLPYDYPPDMIKRGYGEQYLLAQALIQSPERYEILFPSFFLAQHADWKKRMNTFFWSQLSLGSQVEQHGGSFWFRIK